MGTDLGYEFSDGHFVSDVLLRSASAIDFPCDFQRKEIILQKKSLSWVCINFTHTYGRLLCLSKISLDENEKCDILRLQNFTKQKGKKEWGCELRNLLRFNC